MNIKRIWTLTINEILHGPKDVVLIMAVVMPLALALFANLAFGTIFTDRSKLGIYDEGNSQIVPALEESSAMNVTVYDNELTMKAAAEKGTIDMGIVIPPDFDSSVLDGTVKLKAYIWGESLAKNRTTIAVILADKAREITGMETPVNIETVPLGDTSSIPWNNRLLPLTVMFAVFFGGMMIPATALIHEKAQRTLEALNVTPATVKDIFTSKGIIGIFLAIVMGVITLSISGSFGGSPLALFLVLLLGAIFAAEIGLIVGAYIKDITTLFAFWKFGGLLLFGPAFIFMFPQIPQWIGYIFPTYYLIRPIFDLSVYSASFGSVALYVGILAAIVVIMLIIVGKVVNRLSAQALKLA